MSSTPMLVPTRIVLHQISRVLEVEFGDGFVFRLPTEFLRVYSPSAEVKGHGPGQEVLQVGKRDVTIVAIEQVGHYAIQPTFSDGHVSGIFSWDLLYRLGREQDTLWTDYLARLDAAGASRDEASSKANGLASAARGCGQPASAAPPAVNPTFGAELSRKRN
ncbi:MAG: DUF971 domain-containing protein [Betaproteobacteria bacterium]|jgi:DUF971 family protein|nr:DUF971 domain-containing protein [Betaproteobacteria bacterium]NBY16661.1 DUF971 domain-containing protein [Betaproteobacteria bacterium]